MIRIQTAFLNASDLNSLSLLQNDVNNAGTYAQQVERAKQKFDTKPKPLFNRVRDALANALGDLVRCGYCEDSCADEVEHVWPKNYFPGRTFVHDNYLFACGICNPVKSDKFCIYDGNNWVDLANQRAIGIITKPIGTVSKFIDPLEENPMDYLWMDISGKTFHFVPIHTEGTMEYERAHFTRESLRLNRGFLVKCRENAYTGFLDRMHMYISRKLVGDDPIELTNRLKELRRAPHQTVRLEIARQIASTTLPNSTLTDHPELFQ